MRIERFKVRGVNAVGWFVCKLLTECLSTAWVSFSSNLRVNLCKMNRNKEESKRYDVNWSSHTIMDFTWRGCVNPQKPVRIFKSLRPTSSKCTKINISLYFSRDYFTEFVNVILIFRTLSNYPINKRFNIFHQISLYFSLLPCYCLWTCTSRFL
jgi:hypothetical protein